MQIAWAKGKISLRSFSIFLGIILLFVIISLAAANAVLGASTVIYEGVSVGNINVGGLSVHEARLVLDEAFKQQASQAKMTVRHQQNSWFIMPQDIDLIIDAEALAQQAYNVGRSGSVAAMLKNRYQAVNGGYSIPLAQDYNQDKLQTILEKISKQINTEPKNAAIQPDGKNIAIQREEAGQQLDIVKSTQDFSASLQRALNFTIDLTVHKNKPSISVKDFNDIDSLLAVYSTQFNPIDKNRYKNLEIATRKVSEVLLRPDEVFSFNDTVGLRLPEYGYKEAPAFIDGRLVLDWGGGVCQVSTTLYNAALLADLGILERTSHYQPPAYVPLGQDAAVADNILDFKFKNTSGHNLYITSQIVHDQIIVFIYGQKKTSPEDIRIENSIKKVPYKTVAKPDPTLPVGKEVVESEGQIGFEVYTYRVKIKQGKEVSRENLGFDEFKPTDRILRVGSKPPAATTPR